MGGMMRILAETTTALLAVVLTLIPPARMTQEPPTTGVLPTTGALDLEEFRRIQSQLEPPPDEPWRTIPWKISLLDAQHIAVAEEKPIFIWAMDGHPLGCT